MKEFKLPGLMAVAPRHLFSAAEISTYEREILGNPRATELDASRFFARYPKFLHIGTGGSAELRREMVLLDQVGRATCRVDFFRRSFGRSFWDIIELKDPRKPFVVGTNGHHPHLSAEVGVAIDQALDYRDLLDQNTEVRNRLRKKGILVWRPQIIVVVGQIDDSVPVETLQVLYDRIRQRGAIEAWSYTEIWRFAREHYESSGITIVPATHLSLWETSEQNLIEILLRRAADAPDISSHELDLLIALLKESVPEVTTISGLSHLIRSAQSLLDKAEEAFGGREFGPFWDSIEGAAQVLSCFNVARRILIFSLLDTRSLPDPTATAQHLRRLISGAQKDFEFAVIFEHRRVHEPLLRGWIAAASA
ncbi:MAG: hypothetical protein QOH06_1066 [Acidobacteriota bacterium]|jgi:hypothetical protein|nr:hypothetical protein [Acidobacteriota bacterium]